MKREWKTLLLISAVFAACFYLPVGSGRFDASVLEALQLVRWYAREHVLLCLVPAFFIAGAISVFISQGAVMRYLGADAKKVLAYGVASVSGSVLAVCSCTVLPLFAGIYRMGAGLGPASAFLYAGPAINVLAIILTARVLGLDLGLARAVGAVVFSIVIGLAMHFLFRGDEEERVRPAMHPLDESPSRPLWQNGALLALMVALLIAATWARPDTEAGAWYAVYRVHWPITGVFAVFLAAALVRWLGVPWWKMALATAPVIILGLVFPHQPLAAFVLGIAGLSVVAGTQPGEPADWLDATWGFARQIMPLLLAGVFVAGLLLGRPGEEGLIPAAWVARLVGGNSLWANSAASVVGAFMYFATLTEIPILQGLLGSGMGKGPALALLLSGPALSLPNMLVIRSVLGTKKTVTYVTLVVVMSTLSGLVFGAISMGG